MQDQTLMSLLQESRRAYESQKQLQTSSCRKRNLLRSGNIVAGAASEIESSVQRHHGLFRAALD